MFTKLNSKKIILFLTILFSVFFVILNLIQFEEKTFDPFEEPTDNPAGYTLDDRQFKKFTAQLETEDPKSVYFQIVKNTANSSFKTKHDLAHIFGKALYAVKNKSGISVCDSNLSFGCYHGLFSAAVAKEGVGIIPILDKSCAGAGQDLYTGCQHGIGHGLVEYYGRKKIPEALAQCKKIQKNLLVGCSSGVFMEYFVPNPPNPESIPVELFNNDYPFKPCRHIESPFINSCIFEIPRLWRRNSTNFSKFKNNCLRLDQPNHQKSCFRGLGYITVNSTKPDPNFSLSVCQQIPNDQAKLFCLAGATGGYRTIDKTEIVIEAIKTLCTYSSNEKECRKLSNFNLDRI